MIHDDVEEPDESCANHSPFEAPSQGPVRSSKIDSGPSVYDEPWMRADREIFEAPPDPVGGLNRGTGPAEAEHSVWDEPGLSTELSGAAPADALTWFRWYHEQTTYTSELVAWAVTLTISAGAGLWAILGALYLQPAMQFPIVLAVIGAPITEEILKISLPIWVAEKRPWLFKSSIQIIICGVASGLAFAVIENLMYLNVYIADPEPELILWRWTVCVLLHSGCSTIASIGVVRVWQHFQTERRIPRLSDGTDWIISAIFIHGAYNFAAIAMELLTF